MCDMMCMDDLHILLGISWKYDWKYLHDSEVNTYVITKDNRKYVMNSLKEKKREVDNDTHACIIISNYF